MYGAECSAISPENLGLHVQQMNIKAKKWCKIKNALGKYMYYNLVHDFSHLH
jgi:hypothetical protein